MKRMWIGLLAALFGSWLAAGVAWADDPAWNRMFCVGKEKQVKHESRHDPSILTQLDRGTKKFFRGVGDVLTLKPLRQQKPEPQPKMHWMNQKPAPKKHGFWDRLFGPPEPPPPPKSLKEFMKMKRMDP